MSEHQNDVGGIAAQKLRQTVEKIERLEAEIAGIREDVKEVLNDAGSNGFDKKIIRKIVAMRKKSKEERQEEEELTALYLIAMGDE